MDIKKRPWGLSTHHLIGCKDRGNWWFGQIIWRFFAVRRVSRRFAARAFCLRVRKHPANELAGYPYYVPNGTS